MDKIMAPFSKFQKAFAEAYGSPYGCGEEEGKYGDLPVEDPWVICPNCDEPIYLTDCIYREDDKEYWDCPACCCIEDNLLED